MEKRTNLFSSKFAVIFPEKAKRHELSKARGEGLTDGDSQQARKKPRAADCPWLRVK
jgi:hypothetical protein